MTGGEVNTAPLPVDWSRFTGPVSTTCYCRCGVAYRSHCKTVKHNEVWLLVTQRSCPGCGRVDDCRRASSDPETFTIRSENVAVCY